MSTPTSTPRPLAVPTLILNNGQKMPAVGMGCWMGQPGKAEEVKEMCKKALEIGYRHFDTASGYANEKAVGEAIRESGIPREEIFVTTKLWSADHHRVEEAFENSLKELDIGYIDLYLMHWPQAIIDNKVLPPGESPTFTETYLSMQRLLSTHPTHLRSIGISNFSILTLTTLLASPDLSIIPAVNQIEMHPHLPQSDLKAFCDSKGIKLVAYSPLGAPPAADEEDRARRAKVKGVAEKYGVSEGTVVLSWGVKRGTAVIPKSANPKRMRDNFNLIDLSDEDIQVLDGIHQEEDQHMSLLTFYAEAPGQIFGWTYEQLGWERDERGHVISKA
ncbi:aldo/keto reductase [Stereum hirsutum FP-91666 SS1]|uniref:aldo/keto reductase n=1 Tax=Stereum hirsutum (strain FP-91666) TaxID=721885 RepID=UPI0004449692|nr:aldo/keto reductase [Stereum hirsutum FP-91666 SS1]EIM83523.1 aado/keto reductase [Stereum hirsutum FP-91666 SS1]